MGSPREDGGEAHVESVRRAFAGALRGARVGAIAAILVAIGSLSACGGSGGGGGIVAVFIVEESADVQGGAAPTSTQLHAVVQLTDGTIVPVASPLWPVSPSWSIDDPAIATVDGGMVTG